MPAALAAILRRLAVALATDFEGTMKKVGGVLLAVILGVLLIMALPIIILNAVPTIFFHTDKADLEYNQEIIDLYRESDVVNNELQAWVDEWVEGRREVYAESCDSIIESVTVSIPWNELMALDTLLVEQKFASVSRNSILSTAKRFITRESHTETKNVRRSRTVTNAEGKRVTEHYTVTVKYGYITVKTLSLAEVMADRNLAEEDIQLVQNYNYFLSSLDPDGTYTPIDVGELDLTTNGNANIVYYSQRDTRWGSRMYGDETVRAAGCGPTSLAMVVTSLTGKVVNPYDMSQWAYRNGYKAPGSGSYHSLMSSGAEAWGLNVQSISASNPQAIVQALSANKPVIAIMGPGVFTSSGHFIVLVGIQDGKIMVNDPWSTENTEKLWDLGLIVSQSKGSFWAYG